MPAGTPKQLDELSEEACRTLHEHADRLGISTTDVAAQALPEFRSSPEIRAPIVTVEQADANRIALLESVRARSLEGTATLTSDHGDLFDNFGLGL